MKERYSALCPDNTIMAHTVIKFTKSPSQGLIAAANADNPVNTNSPKITKGAWVCLIPISSFKNINKPVTMQTPV